ncbi:MAG: aldehyde dehydrogenase family protein, partial [Candidatus Puniceispirillaceae bacterium]
MTDTVLHYIGGSTTKGTSTRVMDVYNPALGEKKSEVVMGTAADVEAAVAAARKIFPSWASTPPVRRARVMFKFLELVRRDKEKLAEVITSEHGKVFTDACGEVERGIEVIEFACGIPALLKGEYSAQAST